MAPKESSGILATGRPAERISDTRKVDLVIREGRVLERRALRFAGE